MAKTEKRRDKCRLLVRHCLEGLSPALRSGDGFSVGGDDCFGEPCLSTAPGFRYLCRSHEYRHAVTGGSGNGMIFSCRYFEPEPCLDIILGNADSLFIFQPETVLGFHMSLVGRQSIPPAGDNLVFRFSGVFVVGLTQTELGIGDFQRCRQMMESPAFRR